MSDPPVAKFDMWRVRIVLSLAAVLGLGGLGHELFLTSNPSWLKIVASCTAISGQFVSLLNIAGRLGPGSK